MRAYRVVTIQSVRREYVVMASSNLDAALAVTGRHEPRLISPQAVTESPEALQHVLAEPASHHHHEGDQS